MKKEGLFMKVKKYLNKKGFTLVELLAVIVILSIVLGITIYVATSLINNAKEKTYQTTINNIEKKSGSYLAENSNRLFFLAKEDDPNEYQCITVKNLIDYGYLDNNVIKSKISNNKTVTENDYIYVERNINSKAITKVEYIYDLTSEAAKTCDLAVSALGDIIYSLSPSNDIWAREKTLTITYKINNLNDINTAEEYTYGFTYSGNSEPKSAEDNSVSKTINVTSNGTISAYIKAPKLITSIASNKYGISKIDREGPVVTLGANEIKTVKRTVTIPIKVTDSDSGVNYASFTKEDIEVTIGNTSINNFTLNKKDNSGNYELTINDTNNDGKVTIKVKENSIYDNVVDAVKNGNEETTLTTNITFDSNYTVEVKVVNGNGATTKTVKYDDTSTFTVTPNSGYGEPVVSCTNSQTAAISSNTLTTGKITNNTVCTVTYKTLASISFNYSGTFIVCTGTNYGTCTGNKTGNYTLTSKPWLIKLLSSGTLKVTSISSKVDIFLVGGGGGGSQSWCNTSIPASTGGAGGGGGNRTTKTAISFAANGQYVATIGAGGAGGTGGYQADGGSGGTTSLTNCSGCSAAGGTGATDYNKPGTGGSTGGIGMYAYLGSVTQATSGGNGAYAFNSSAIDGIKYGAAGGGGGTTYLIAGNGGTTGGGLGGGKHSNNITYTGGAGTSNTGAGGGGGSADSYGNATNNAGYPGGAGGTGIIIIKNNG